MFLAFSPHLDGLAIGNSLSMLSFPTNLQIAAKLQLNP